MNPPAQGRGTLDARFGPTASEYLQAFAPAAIGLLVAGLLLGATLSAHRIVAMTIAGAVIALMAFCSAFLEYRDLPRRSLRDDGQRIVVHHTGRGEVHLGHDDVALVQLVTVPDRLWHLIPRHQVWLEFQTLGNSSDFQQRHPGVRDYEPASDEADGGFRMPFGHGRRRLSELDSLLRSTVATYSGVRHESRRQPVRVRRSAPNGRHRGAAGAVQGRTRGRPQHL